MRYVICYDISNNKRRKKVADILDSYGDRIQNSVFEMVASDKIFQICLKKVKQSIDQKNDQIAVYKLCASCNRKALYLGVASDSCRIGEETIFVV